MVTSYIALRTRIKQQYGLTSVKVEEGLFVPIRQELLQEQDKVLYSCTPSGSGVIFKLKDDLDSRARPLPVTEAAFLSSCTRRGIQIDKTSIEINSTPQILCSEMNGILHLPDFAYNKGISSYTVVEITIGSHTEAEKLLVKNTYIRSSKNPEKYRVLFRNTTPRENRAEAINIIEFLATVIQDAGIKAPLYKGKEIISMVLEGQTELLFEEARTDPWE